MERADPEALLLATVTPSNTPPPAPLSSEDPFADIPEAGAEPFSFEQSEEEPQAEDPESEAPSFTEPEPASDLERHFLHAVLQGGTTALNAVLRKGFDPSLLRPDLREIFVFVRSYADEYRAFPTLAILAERFRFQAETPKGTAEFFLDEIYKREMAQHITEGVRQVLRHLEAQNPYKALEVLSQLQRDARRREASASVTTLMGMLPDLLTHYDKVKAGLCGIPSPWPTVTKATLGWWPADLVTFVARLGAGKTQAAVVMAIHAWLKGHKVLFATMEMGALAIARRMIASACRFPFGDFRRGQLPEAAEVFFRKLPALDALKRLPDLYISGGGFSANPEILQAQVEQYEPELVLVDGAYLLAMQGNTATESAARVFDFLKTMAQRVQKPVITTTQFNRQGAKEALVENIGLTDRAGWNADAVFALYRTEDDVTDGRLTLKALKIREGELIPAIQLNWDFDRMDFSERPGAGVTYTPGQEIGVLNDPALPEPSTEHKPYRPQPVDEDPNDPFYGLPHSRVF